MATNPWDAFPAVQQQPGPVYGAPDPAEGRAQNAEVRAQQDQSMQIANMGRTADNDASRLQIEQERLRLAQEAAQREADKAKTGNAGANAKRATMDSLVDQINRVTDLYNKNVAPEQLANLYGALDALGPQASQFNSAGQGVADQALSAFRVPGVGAQSDLEAKQFASANTPQAGDWDVAIEEKLGNLKRRVDANREAMGLPPANWLGYTDQGLETSVTDDSAAAGGGSTPAGPTGGIPPQGDTEGGIMDLAKQGATFGLADEAAGVGGYLSGFLTGEDPQAAYVRERDGVRARVADARRDSPILGTAVELLGGGGAARVAAPVVNALGGVIRQGAALGGVGGFGYGEGAQGSVGGAAIGGAFGGALGGITQGIGRGVNALARRIGTAATPAQQETIQAGAREGVRVMTSDVRPPQSFTAKAARGLGERIPFAGTGGPRAAQQAERVTAVQNVLNDFNAADAADAVGDVSADLIATRGAEIGRLSNQKNAVISGIQGAVPAPKAIAAIDQQIAKLAGVNEEAFAPVIQKMTQFRDALASGKTLEQVEGNRKLLGDLFADPSLASIKGDGQKSLNAIYGPLRQDMGDFIKQAGGRAKFSRWKNANDRLSAMAGELKSGAFKGLLNNAETTPEAAARIIFNGTASDMQRVFNSLSPAGKVKAQSAILFKAAQGSVDGDSISPQKFATAMGKLNDATKTFFDPADKARLDGLTRLLKSTQRASEAAALPPTGVQNSQLAGGFTLGTLFGTAALPVAGGLGLLARAYESAPVRNALLRLGRTTAGSGAESKAVETVRQALTRFAANDNRAAAMAASPGRAAADESDSRREPVR